MSTAFEKQEKSRLPRSRISAVASRAVRVPIAVMGEPGTRPISEATTTLVVNAHGALLLLAHQGSHLPVSVNRNLSSGEELLAASCTVGPPRKKDRDRVEFETRHTSLLEGRLSPDDWGATNSRYPPHFRVHRFALHRRLCCTVLALRAYSPAATTFTSSLSTVQ